METLLTINEFTLMKRGGSYQIYKGDFCLYSMRGNYKKIKKYFKDVSKSKINK